MPSRLKKTRKLRGHVSHGHGRVGKHRKVIASGSGFCWALLTMLASSWSRKLWWFEAHEDTDGQVSSRYAKGKLERKIADTIAIGYFGKVGMRTFHLTRHQVSNLLLEYITDIYFSTGVLRSM